MHTYFSHSTLRTYIFLTYVLIRTYSYYYQFYLPTKLTKVTVQLSFDTGYFSLDRHIIFQISSIYSKMEFLWLILPFQTLAAAQLIFLTNARIRPG